MNNNLSNWFSEDKNYKVFIYEDIFIRKYISSFITKFNKTKKVLGSIYIFRTYGKLYIKLFYFNSFNIQRSILKKKRVFIRKFSLRKVRPINKYKKQLLLLKLFFNLEKVLNYQIYYRFINIFNLRKNDKKLIQFFYYKLRKYRISKSVLLDTSKFLINLFSFKTPDGFLLASFISHNLCFLAKHSFFLMFFIDFLKIILSLYKHVIGVKIVISGKLNGFSRSQVKKMQVGRIPLQTWQVNNNYGFSESFTKYGKLGIKVWIFYMDRCLL